MSSDMDLTELTADDADIVRVQGDTTPIPFTITDTAGNPVDLTGASVHLWIANHGEILVVNGKPGTVTNELGGEAQYTPDPTDLDLPAGAYAMQVEYDGPNAGRSVYPATPLVLYVQGTFVPVASGSGSGSGSG